jgi:hypothetical protein
VLRHQHLGDRGACIVELRRAVRGLAQQDHALSREALGKSGKFA